MYNKQPVTISEKTIFNTTKIIHLALLAGQLLFAVMAFVVNKNAISLNLKNTNNDVFFLLVPIFAISCIALGIFIFKKQLSDTQQNTSAFDKSLSDKIKRYQAAFIVRAALTEGPSLFGIVVFLLTGNLFYLIISGCIIVYFLTLRPTIDGVADALQLSYDEKQELQ
ncbi:hypothetical protein [Mucilaginibacter sp. FT3.2]|uniref:hypothetical protein n=1 Tax=Mucilaginibacter sp. FT3.2 TaxID=2723090 RepID=UPI00161AF86C|nr:hypothetical protein [Mucilaginibacter sp. FT3.2]MBB6234891.1 hypothetical protein [Mucilaginibacter sp. FT3.2]